MEKYKKKEEKKAATCVSVSALGTVQWQLHPMLESKGQETTEACKGKSHHRYRSSPREETAKGRKAAKSAGVSLSNYRVLVANLQMSAAVRKGAEDFRSVLSQGSTSPRSTLQCCTLQKNPKNKKTT